MPGQTRVKPTIEQKKVTQHAIEHQIPQLMMMQRMTLDGTTEDATSTDCRFADTTAEGTADDIAA